MLCQRAGARGYPKADGEMESLNKAGLRPGAAAVGRKAAGGKRTHFTDKAPVIFLGLGFNESALVCRDIKLIQLVGCAAGSETTHTTGCFSRHQL
jgi:hypothetical protein